mgnify:CR=1 FL=1
MAIGMAHPVSAYLNASIDIGNAVYVKKILTDKWESLGTYSCFACLMHIRQHAERPYEELQIAKMLMQMLKDNDGDEYIYDMWEVICDYPDLGMIKLFHENTDVDLHFKGDCLFYNVCKHGKRDAIRYLVAQGFDPKDDDYRAFRIAILSARDHTLLKMTHMSKLSQDELDSLLLFACEDGNHHCVRSMVSAGADIFKHWKQIGRMTRTTSPIQQSSLQRYLSELRVDYKQYKRMKRLQQ